MTEIPLKPKNYQNASKTYKMTKIPPKLEKIIKLPRNLKND